MTDSEFDTYLATALDELKKKQDYLEAEFGLGRYERFFVDYEKLELQFLNGEQVALSFAITPVGSHVPEKNSWQWSWGNKSLPEHVRQKAAAAQKLYDISGMDVFKQPTAAIDEAMAWEFVALSAKATGAMGAYSMPQRNLRAYVLIDSPTNSA
jgi:hypothetical protein